MLEVHIPSHGLATVSYAYASFVHNLKTEAHPLLGANINPIKPFLLWIPQPLIAHQ